MTDDRRRILLSTLWIFVLLNILFRDVHELFRPGVLDAMASGVMNGREVTEQVMLAGAIAVELMIVMVILSQILPQSLARWGNLAIAAIAALGQISLGTNDLDDGFFLIMELAGLAGIFYLAITWRKNVNRIKKAA